MNITEMLAAGNNTAKELIRDPRQGLDDGKVGIWSHAKWLHIMMLGEAKFISHEPWKQSEWELPNGVHIFTDGTYIW